MKKQIVLIIAFIFTYVYITSAQGCGVAPNSIPQLETKSGITYWGGYPINDVVKEAELIFEGKVLTDSSYFENPPGHVCTYHHVLILKQFKGIFKTDTIIVVNGGGRMILNGSWEGHRSYVTKGDEALFFATCGQHLKLAIHNNPDLFYIIYGEGCGFVKVCDKKDVVKEVYEPIEAATGQPYIDVHPNSCKGQQSQQK